MLLFAACGGEKKALLFEIRTKGTSFQQNDTIDISIKNEEGEAIKKIVYSIDGQELSQKDGQVVLSLPKLGSKILKARVSYDDTATDITKKIKILAENAPEIYTYEIVNEYPHDNKAYTQGLEFHNDTLYEGTGKTGRSFLRKVDFRTGKSLDQIDLDDTIFGEGITILNGKIYQLSWQSGIGFIYDLNSFKKIDNFQYGESKEGWGLTNDGTKIYKSDGTEKIWILDPETLKEEGYIEIVTNKSIFNNANELEYVDGKIYANVYQKPSVMIIDAESGAIEGVVNFGGLSAKITKGKNWSETDNVLNGIAYHPERKTFFVTGKDWDKMFEVNIIKK
jgi:glutamine cyclotransferase